MQEFCMVGDYTEDLEKPHNCQNWMQALAQGWGFAQGWALARDNMGELTLVVWYMVGKSTPKWTHSSRYKANYTSLSYNALSTY